MFAQLDPLYLRMRPRKALTRVLSHVLFQGRFLTTDHRWLNHFVLAELGLLRHLPQVKRVQKPIWIVGTGRSGSTVLGKVLSMHQAIGFLNEPKALWYTVCPHEDVNGHFSDGPARYRLTNHDVTPENREAARRLFAAYLTVTGTDRVVDKNPEMIFRASFVREIFPDAKFVFLVRNGWDTIASIAKWSRFHSRVVEDKVEDWWGTDQRKWQLIVRQLVPSEPLLAQLHGEIESFTRYQNMAAVEWIVTMQEGLRLMRSMPEAVHLLRFENLTTSPKGVLTRLLRFCELPDDPIVISYAQEALEVVPPKRPLDLDRAIRGPFYETMRMLDYLTEQ